MKLSLYSPAIVALLGLMLVNMSPLHGAADPSKPRPLPFHGKLKSVDASAQTITIEGKKADRVFSLTPETKITDGAGNPSTLAAATPGEDVGGSYTKDATGKMTLGSVRFGAKTGEKAEKKAAAAAPAAAPAPIAATPPPAPAPVAAAPEKAATAPAPEAKVKKQTFAGKVVSVDAAANTLVIHGKADQTFTITSETKITGAAGLAALSLCVPRIATASSCSRHRR